MNHLLLFSIIIKISQLLAQCQIQYTNCISAKSDNFTTSKSRIKACYINQNCRDPTSTLSEQQSQARLKCFSSYKDMMRQDLIQCVQKTNSDYVLPPWTDSDVLIGQLMLSLKDFQCQAIDQTTLNQCLSGSRINNLCSIQSQCYQQASYTKDCFRQNVDGRRRLCECSKKLEINIYKDLYIECLTREKLNQSSDYNLAVLDSLNGDKNIFCDDSTFDACGLFQTLPDGNENQESVTYGPDNLPKGGINLKKLFNGKFDPSTFLSSLTNGNQQQNDGSFNLAQLFNGNAFGSQAGNFGDLLNGKMNLG